MIPSYHPAWLNYIQFKEMSNLRKKHLWKFFLDFVVRVGGENFSSKDGLFFQKIPFFNPKFFFFGLFLNLGEFFFF